MSSAPADASSAPVAAPADTTTSAPK
jgi:hypothetical protein